MSSSEKRYPRAEALMIAGDLIDCLAPACERLEIAGSYRRGKATVGDLELVAIAKEQKIPVEDLFGPTGMDELVNLVHQVFRQPIQGWSLEKSGPLYKQLKHNQSGLAVDLYLGTARNWGGMLVVRTGPGDFSTALVQRARRLGMQVSGGYHIHRHPARLDADGKALPCQFGAECTQIVETPTEDAFFKALGLPVFGPDRREENTWTVRRMR